MELTSLTLAETRRGIADKKFSAAELTNAYLDRIAKLDPKIESYLHVDEKAADKISDSGNLAGMPIGLKDVFCTTDMPTTAASKILEGYVPPYEATTVEKLRAAGATFLGKLNTDEFTMGSSTETSAYKITKNPWDLERVPGGSSGGSAAAVAADLCVAATATDTGGSIRQPASLCGVTGLKVTYGRVSRYGTIPMASSLDTIGWIGKSVEDIAILLKETAGHDPRDATTSTAKVPNYPELLRTDLKGQKVGIPKEYFVEGLDSRVEKIVREAISQIEKLGAEIVEVSLPHTEYAVACYYIVAPSEISANLARFDGIRFGPTDLSKKDLVELYFENRTRGFGDEVKRRIMLGTFALSAGYADKFYKKALQVRTLVKRDFDEAFTKVDFIAAPACPTPAFKIGEKTDDPLAMYLEDAFTIPASLAGVPGVSVPAGFAEGLPVGLQLLAPQFQEAELLAAAHAFQISTDWHTHKPQL